MKVLLSRQILKERHRLSHQQIDMLLNEKQASLYMQDKLKGLELVRSYLHFIDLLNEHRIAFLSIKGPLLSQLIYGDASVRFSHDFDILVDKSEVVQINSLLLQNGFQPEYDIMLPESEKKQQMLMELSHHLGYSHKERGYFVEVHWTLVSDSPVSQKRLQEVVMANTKEYAINGRKVWSLNEEMMLAYLIIHGTKHGWQRLKWLVDIKDYPFAMISAERFEQIAQDLNIKKAVSQTNALLRHYFGVSIKLMGTTKGSKRSTDYCIRCISEPVTSKLTVMQGFVFLLYRFSIFQGIAYKLRIARSLLISITDIKQSSSENRLFLILYRPYSFIKRRLLHASS